MFRTIRHAELDSTNTEAARLLREGLEPPPFVLRTDRQTAGRGRGANAWWSDAGSLTFTVALDPAEHGLRTEHTPRVALVAGLAIIEAVEAFVPPGTLGLRWPNDVEAQGRKLAGI